MFMSYMSVSFLRASDVACSLFPTEPSPIKKVLHHTVLIVQQTHHYNLTGTGVGCNGCLHHRRKKLRLCHRINLRIC